MRASRIATIVLALLGVAVFVVLSTSIPILLAQKFLEPGHTV